MYNCQRERQAKVRKNIRPKKSAKNQFNIPTKKLPNILSHETCTPLWKKIIQSIENKEVQPILDFIQTIDKCDEVPCLPHPFMEAVDTFPTQSVREGMCNFIFFSDSYGKNQWILCQGTSFLDAIFSTTFSGKHALSINEKTIINSVKRVLKKERRKHSKQSGNKKAIFSGYLLDQTRPYHHFYDQLKWMVQLEAQKPVVSQYSFFSPKFLNRKFTGNKKNKPSFSMFPLVIGSNQMGMKLDRYTETMEKVVYQDSLKGLRGGVVTYRWQKFIKKLKKISSRKKTLTLWFGISGQKRIWIEQEDFLPTLVEQLSPWFDSFVFLIDGFTQYEDNRFSPMQGSKETPVSQDLEVVDSIRQKLLPFSNASVVCLVGQTYRKKIQRCQSADFFIANAGAGQLVPHRFCRKPGILHSNEKHCVFPMGINNTSVKLVDKSVVKDVGNLFAKGKRADRSGTGLISYSINIQIVINMIKEMLKLHN